MQELVSQLGLDFKLLLSQGANFLIVVGVLTFLVYKPLLKILNERREKIELGLKVGEEAEKQLKEIEVSRKEILSEADKQAVKIVSESEALGKKREIEIVAMATEKSSRIMVEAEKTAEAKANESFKHLSKEAANLMRDAITRATAADPKSVDENLISRATEGLKVALTKK